LWIVWFINGRKEKIEKFLEILSAVLVRHLIFNIIFMKTVEKLYSSFSRHISFHQFLSIIFMDLFNYSLSIEDHLWLMICVKDLFILSFFERIRLIISSFFSRCFVQKNNFRMNFMVNRIRKLKRNRTRLC